MWSRFVMSQVKHNSYFVVGMCVGLWVSLALVPLEDEAGAVCPAAAPLAGAALPPDDYEPRREDKPLGSGGAPAAGRAVQRPRYYTTELGMRGSLLTGVLSSEAALKEQVPALNRTLARLQPALKFFITASAMSSVPGLANVVGFTDTREMLKPFHALKYLADNYLEEYDFFFLVTDTAFVNVQRLTELVSSLSVSQDVYMGQPAAAGSSYCSLEAGVLLSNSVLRAVHAELEWCVRNSYSPHHHDNVGRCVLHAARTPCTDTHSAQRYRSLAVEDADGADALAAGGGGALAGAVTARGAGARALPALRALCARAALQRDAARARRLAAAVRRATPRHPPHYRNHTWPAGLRLDPGLLPPPPDNRFSHVRWTLFNATHAFMEEARAAAPHDAAHAAALRLVMEHVSAWAGARVRLVEGARAWHAPHALRYRLLVRAEGAGGGGGGGGGLRLVEVARPLGAARLAPVRYVTESARVTLVVPLAAHAARDLPAFLARYDRVALHHDKNTELYVVWTGGANESAAGERVAALMARREGGAAARLLLAPEPRAADAAAPEAEREQAAARAALRVLRVPHDALLLVLPPHLDFNQDFLNRVRMNTIMGESWFLPVAFSRHAHFAHPGFRGGTGTGRFAHAPRAPLLAAYARDVLAALAAWRGAPHAPLHDVLAASALRAVRAPDPGAVLAPRAPPCSLAAGEQRARCLRRLQEERFERLDLGARNLLAQLLLETAADT